MRAALGLAGRLLLIAAGVPSGASPAAAVSLVLEVAPEDPRCAAEEAPPQCSLQAALAAVNAAGAGVIRLAPGSLHTLAKVVAINGHEGGSGLPSVTGDVVLEGHGAVVERSPAAGTPVFRIFHVAPGGRLAIRDLIVKNGATETHTDGAGLWNAGTLELERVTVTGNVAGDDGGGIRNDGVLRLVDCLVSGNRASGEGGVGGGLYNLPVQGAGEATVLRSLFADNEAGGRGGALWNSGTMVLEDSVLTKNSARVGGGGLCTTGPVRLTRCRVLDNQAGGRAGGISALGPVEALETTVSGNTAPADPDFEGRLTFPAGPAAPP